MTMTARIRAAESMPTPSGGPLKSGSCRRADPAVATSSERTHGTSHEDAPEAVDDRRNGRQQLGQEDERLLEPPRAEFGDEDGDAERIRASR